MPPIYDHKNNRSDIMEETKKYAEEILIKQPHLAAKAIHERNYVIKALKAEIEHRKIAFQEIEYRYEQACASMDENKKLIEANTTLSKELIEYKNSSDAAWHRRITAFSEKLPRFAGAVVRFCFTPPVSTYLWLILFALFFIASITGWGFVTAAIKPIFLLFGIGA